MATPKKTTPASASPVAKAPKAPKPKAPAGPVAATNKKAQQGPKVREDVKGTRTGVVESDKRHQTRTVVVNYMSQHPKYGKYIRQRTVLQVHDGQNQSKLGDIVEVAPCRPVSKSKRWALVRIVERRSAQVAALASAKEISQ